MRRHRKRGWISRVVRVVASVATICAFCASLVCSYPGEEVLSKTNSLGDRSSEHGVGEDRWGPRSVPPACPSSTKADDHFMLVVSTIDGSVSAVDMRSSGDILWSVQGDERPLLSASITNIQVTRDGVSTRLIPSLDGGLYEFDGEDIKAIPMTAESLLSSSVRITDNCVMVGGKEVGSYGVDVNTGQLSYKCTSAGCKDTGEAGNSGGDMLLITRNMQTVRAVEVNSGSEKWNFSVGQHDLLFVASKKDKPGIEQDGTDSEYSDEDVTLDNCFPFSNEEENKSVDEDQLKQLIKVVVSDGLIVALNPDDPSQMAWSRKFSSPVAKAWILHRGKLEELSLFDSKVVPSLASQSFQQPFQHRGGRADPLLYVGTHKRQLYVQKEEPDHDSCEKELPWVMDHDSQPSSPVSAPHVTWRPYLSNARSQTPLFVGNEAPEVPLLGHTDEVPDTDDSEGSGTSLTVWHENYPFDMGYYLYPHSLMEDLSDSVQQVEEGIMDVLPASLWMWWKEVVAISVVTSLLVHIFYTRIIYRPVVSETSLQSLDKKESNESMSWNDSNSSLTEDKQSPAEFKSRFADEFECIEQLGKGGFGIVFRAKNKVDEQEYAVKRIALPNSDGDSKKKMLREVRTLAMLDHVGIVRYFHSWMEDPPAGWQEERDRHFTDVLGTSDGYSPSLDTSIASADLNLPSVSASSHSPPPKAANPVRQPPSLLANIMPFGARDFGADLNPASFSRSDTGSGEFSLHPGAEGSTDESGSFSLGGEEQRGGSWENRGGGGWEESNDSFSVVFHNSDSESSISRGGGERSYSGQQAIPFKRYRTGTCRDVSSGAGPGDCVTHEEDSCSIVFEASQGGGDYPKPDKHSKSAVFSDSSYGGSIGDNESNGNNPNTQHPTVEFTLSSHAPSQHCDQAHKEGDKKAAERKDNVALPKLYLYLQMQLCRLDTLKDWLMANTLNRERFVILDIFEQLVSAVDYVHAKGLIHRDLKPSNIFFALDNTVKVGDFGLVTAAEQQPEHTGQSPGNTASGRHTADVGTQLYMSPEQVQKKSYDQKVDIFSLGMIFLELLMPFSTGMERVSTLQNARKGVFPERFCRELPLESDLVKRLMAARAKDRPVTQEILDHDLLKDFTPRRLGPRYRTISGSSSHSDPMLGH